MKDVSKYKAGDLFWAIHKKSNNEYFGLARKTIYGFEFNTVNGILSKNDYETVYAFNLTSVEHTIDHRCLYDLINYTLDLKDKDWFMELTERLLTTKHPSQAYSNKH